MQEIVQKVETAEEGSRYRNEGSIYIDAVDIRKLIRAVEESIQMSDDVSSRVEKTWWGLRSGKL